ncbi:MAG: hypothetical protein IKE30_06560 [Clostridia bacterium]|nr:hypothetical protein [Clostridia bacterium]
MVRTDTVNLTVITAVAFRQKLASGGAGVMILRYDASQPGIAAISKTSGDPIPTANTPGDLYPIEAFREAIALTAGMPYSKRGSVRLEKKAVVEAAPEPEEETTADDPVIDTAEYQKIIAMYTDRNGKLSYELLNRDLIKFAHSSRTVHSMIAEGASTKKVRTYIVTSKFRTVTGNKKLTEEQAMKMGDLLDEVSPRSVFKQLDAELRKSSAANKRK